MSKRISISPKHGLNPSMPVCFWCGKHKNEVLILGKLKGDKKAPREAIYDYEPCEECKKARTLGFTIMETSDTPYLKDMLPINAKSIDHTEKELYPTSRWAVMKQEAAEKVFGKNIAANGGVYVDKETYEHLIPENMR